MPTEFGPESDHSRITAIGGLRCIFCCQATFCKELAGAIVFESLPEIRNASDLPGAGIDAAVEFAVNYDSRAHAGTESDSDNAGCAATLAETVFAKSKAVRIIVDADFL